MNEIVLPAIIEGLKDDKYPTPEEYSYWKARQNRTFYNIAFLLPALNC